MIFDLSDHQNSVKKFKLNWTKIRPTSDMNKTENPLQCITASFGFYCNSFALSMEMWPEKADIARSCRFSQNRKYGQIIEKWPGILDVARLVWQEEGE